MAVVFDAAGEALYRTADIPNDDPITFMCWFYLISDVNNFQVIALHSDAAANNFWELMLNSDGTTLRLSTRSGGGSPTATNGSGLTVGAWHHLALTKNGSTHLVYLNGVQDISHTAAVTFTPTALAIGSDTGAAASNRIAAMKVYTQVLSVEEIVHEMRQYQPVRTADLYEFRPLWGTGDTGDYSGNARATWTTNGTLSTGDGPPIPWNAHRHRVIHIPAAAPGGGNRRRRVIIGAAA
jgi:hypothetical protein